MMAIRLVVVYRRRSRGVAGLDALGEVAAPHWLQSTVNAPPRTKARQARRWGQAGV